MEKLPEREKIARLRLARTHGIGARAFKALLKQYGTAAAAIDAIDGAALDGRQRVIHVIPMDEAEKEMAALEALGAALIVYGDADYPSLLATIIDPPIVLTARGNPALLGHCSLAVVGARNASLPAQKLTEQLAKQTAGDGIVVVSGLARGVDRAAHLGALKAGGGTVAVVAGGVDHIYPQENTRLYHDIIAQNGVVIAEMKLGAAPRAEHFPRRNRIISGLSRATLVMEATKRSGSLITARMAAEQGREVLAVPGFPMDARAEGPNKLIRDGATVITAPEDLEEALAQLRSSDGVAQPAFLEEAALYDDEPEAWQNLLDWPLGEPLREARHSPDRAAEISPAGPKKAAPEGSSERPPAVLALLGHYPVTVDALAEQSQLPHARLAVELQKLELSGQIVRHPGNRVSKAG